MSTARKIKPTDKAIKAYYEALQAYRRQDVEHETAARRPSRTSWIRSAGISAGP